MALVTLIAGFSNGRKLIPHFGNGYRESKERWAGVVRELKERRISDLAMSIVYGHLEIWAAFPESFPRARGQRC